jgi:hypothetical protein
MAFHLSFIILMSIVFDFVKHLLGKKGLLSSSLAALFIRACQR